MWKIKAEKKARPSNFPLKSLPASQKPVKGTLAGCSIKCDKVMGGEGELLC